MRFGKELSEAGELRHLAWCLTHGKGSILAFKLVKSMHSGVCLHLNPGSTAH